MIVMNTAIPAQIQARPVFYRETSSNMYHPAAYTLSNFTVEIPWLFAMIIGTLPIVYFMMGLNPDANVFFFHFLAASVLASVYTSIASTVAATAPTFEVAQAVLGILAVRAVAGRGGASAWPIPCAALRRDVGRAIGCLVRLAILCDWLP
jgi:ABC-type multidrug transport system permease subunit